MYGGYRNVRRGLNDKKLCGEFEDLLWKIWER